MNYHNNLDIRLRRNSFFKEHELDRVIIHNLVEICPKVRTIRDV